MVLEQLTAVDTGPGFAESVILAVLLVGMFLGVLGAKAILVLVASSALDVRPAAMNLSWFPATLGVNIVLGLAIAYFAWKSLKEMCVAAEWIEHISEPAQSHTSRKRHDARRGLADCPAAA